MVKPPLQTAPHTDRPIARVRVTLKAERTERLFPPWKKKKKNAKTPHHMASPANEFLNDTPITNSTDCPIGRNRLPHQRTARTMVSIACGTQ